MSGGRKGHTPNPLTRQDKSKGPSIPVLFWWEQVFRGTEMHCILAGLKMQRAWQQKYARKGAESIKALTVNQSQTLPPAHFCLEGWVPLTLGFVWTRVNTTLQDSHRSTRLQMSQVPRGSVNRGITVWPWKRCAQTTQNPVPSDVNKLYLHGNERYTDRKPTLRV